MAGVAVKPLTVDFHETPFLTKLNQENQFGFWFQLSDDEKKQAGSSWGPTNPQALNRYSYVQNNPLRYTDPTGHCPACGAAVGGMLAAAGITVSAPVIAVLAAVFTVGSLAIFLSDAGNRDWLSSQIASGVENVEEFAGDLSHILESRKSDKESATDIPSWARGQTAQPGESGKDAAERLMNEKYGKGNYKTGPGSEYNQLKKYFDRKRK